MIETGTHIADTAPSGLPRSFGHASSSSLSENRCTWARRAAGQWSGESTQQFGGAPVGEAEAMRRRCAWLLSASSSSMGASGTMAENDRSMTWTTSGSPSAMSRALARRLSNLCPRA